MSRTSDLVEVTIARAPNGSLGIELQYSSTRPPVVTEAEGPAKRAGMLAGDILAGVDGVAVPVGRHLGPLLPYSKSSFIFTVKRQAEAGDEIDELPVEMR